jgi:3-oxoacid CoA-transferase subunit B
MEQLAKAKDGSIVPKLLTAYSLPLTDSAWWTWSLATLVYLPSDKKKGGMTLIELAPDTTVDEITSKTQANFGLKLDIPSNS